MILVCGVDLLLICSCVGDLELDVWERINATGRVGLAPISRAGHLMAPIDSQSFIVLFGMDLLGDELPSILNFTLGAVCTALQCLILSHQSDAAQAICGLVAVV